MRFEIFEFFSPLQASNALACLRALFTCVQCRMLVHYKDDNTPFGIKHILENNPVKITHTDYTEHFKPRATVKENTNVTVPTREVAGLCVKVSRHKDPKRRAVKIKPYGRTNIVKVKFQFVFGLPDVASFARDTRNGFWYKVLQVTGEWLLVDAAMVESKKPNAAAEENKESNAAAKPTTESQETAPPPPSRTLLFAYLLYVLFPNPLYVLLPNLLYS